MKNAIRFALLSCSMVGLLASCGGGSGKPAGTDSTATHNHGADHGKPAASGISKAYAVDTEASIVNWEGSKNSGKHTGTLKIKSGTVKVENGQVVGGSFVLDMNSITVTDLTDKAKADLEGHLKNQDFFETNKYAEGKFEITKSADGKIEGNLTLKDKTNPVSFAATVNATETEFTATVPMFNINRQDWGIVYQSKMKDVVINNEMGIAITLKAK